MIKIDSLHRGRMHIRHLADVDDRGVAHTKCGHVVLYFFEAVAFGKPISYLMADGRPYARPCARCLPGDAA